MVEDRWVCPPCRRGDHQATYHLADIPDVQVCFCDECCRYCGQPKSAHRGGYCLQPNAAPTKEGE